MHVYIDPDDVLDELSDEDLIDELERRKVDLSEYFSYDNKSLIESIYQKRRLTGQVDIKDIDALIYHTIGKIV